MGRGRPRDGDGWSQVSQGAEGSFRLGAPCCWAEGAPCGAAVVWLREHQEGTTGVRAEVRVVRTHSTDEITIRGEVGSQ